jgi:hypothetical protein
LLTKTQQRRQSAFFFDFFAQNAFRCALLRMLSDAIIADYTINIKSISKPSSNPFGAQYFGAFLEVLHLGQHQQQINGHEVTAQVI